MNLRKGIEKIKVIVSYMDSRESMKIHNGILNVIRTYSSYIKPKILVESIGTKTIIRDKIQFRIFEDNNEFIIETECLDILVICCSYLDSIYAYYLLECRVNFVFNEKMENLALIKSSKFNDVQINEHICGKRDLITEQYDISILNFNFKSKHLYKHKLSNGVLFSCLNNCLASYLGDFIDKSEAILDCNTIELNKDEIISIKFRKHALDLIEEELKNLRKYLIIDIKDVKNFVIEHNTFV